MNFQHIQRMLEGEKTVNNLNCLVMKLGVAGIVSLLAACGGTEVQPQIKKLPATEIRKPAPDGEVTVGEIEQVNSPKVLCTLLPHTMSDCGGIFYVLVTNPSDFPLVIEEPKFAIME